MTDTRSMHVRGRGAVDRLRAAGSLKAFKAGLRLTCASEVQMRYYLDTEFDGHNGPLLSLALVGENDSIHVRTTERATDPWVIANVEPLMDQHDAGMDAEVPLNEVGVTIASFFSLMRDNEPTIVADSVVDIGRFCRALSTGMDGGWSSVDYPVVRFEVHDVAAYPTTLPGAVQHNAWWDAMALRHMLEPVAA